jgi:glutamate-1-semialdehyde 2,1-aminomutase
MDLCADRTVVGAGTFNGYPLGVMAGVACLSYLERDDGVFYRDLAATQKRLTDGLTEIMTRHGRQWLLQDCPGVIMFYPVPIERAGSIGYWYAIADHDLGERLRQALFDEGVLILFRGRWFFNGAVTSDDVDRTLEIVDRCFGAL